MMKLKYETEYTKTTEKLQICNICIVVITEEENEKQKEYVKQKKRRILQN